MRRRVPPRLYGDYPGQLAYFTRPQSNGCWEFTGYVLPQGYGQLGRNGLAHRFAWEMANGRPVPAGLVVDHQCHNRDPLCIDDTACAHRRCVNPTHLEAVPSKVNILRGKGFAPANARKEACANGHEFTPENTYQRPDRPGRICRTCRDEALRRGRSRWREEARERRAELRRAAKPVDFAIREWAQENGLPCFMSGPISRAVRDQYAEAHRLADTG
jgi:hypothetical protein